LSFSFQKKARKRKQLNKAGKQEKVEEFDSHGHDDDGSLRTGGATEPVDGDAISEKSENWGSNDDNTSNSDADVEDNLESDASRRRSLAQGNMYAPLMSNEEGQIAEAGDEEGEYVEVPKLQYENLGKASAKDGENDTSSSESSSEDEVIEYMKFEDEQEGGTDEAAEQVTKDLENLALAEQAKAEQLSCHGNGVTDEQDCDAKMQNSNSADTIDQKPHSNGVSKQNSSSVDVGVMGGCHGECGCADQSECDKALVVDHSHGNCNNSTLKMEPDAMDSSKDFIKMNGDSLQVPSGDNDDKSPNVSDNILCNHVEGEEKMGGELLGAVGGNVDDLSVSEQSTPKHVHTQVNTKSKKELRKDNVRKAMNSLSNRYQPLAHECSVLSCLNQFTAAELLTGNNKFGCESCSKKKYKEKGSKGKMEMVYTNACKQLLIFRPPAILTLHLKRFQQVCVVLSTSGNWV
jgi:ubiquitin carboxyl-terminal hydrolase 16/45